MKSAFIISQYQQPLTAKTWCGIGVAVLIVTCLCSCSPTQDVKSSVLPFASQYLSRLNPESDSTFTNGGVQVREIRYTVSEVQQEVCRQLGGELTQEGFSSKVHKDGCTLSKPVNSTGTERYVITVSSDGGKPTYLLVRMPQPN